MVFDYMMPNMNGAEFLMEVRKFDQDVVAIFLSGATNFESVTHAVKNGKVFRFLSKPCSGEDLKVHIQEGLQHFHTMRVSNQMLWETMNGTIQEITSLLAAAKPLYFGRAERVKRLASQLAKELGFSETDRLRVSSYYLFFGAFCLYRKKYKRDFIIFQESNPSYSADFEFNFIRYSSRLEKIPRLKRVLEIIIRSIRIILHPESE